MITVVNEADQVDIPAWVVDLESFLRWADSEHFPETGRVCWLGGRVWVDISKEQFTHNQVKGEIASVGRLLAKQAQRGRYFSDGYRLTYPKVDLSTNPDGMFASALALQRGRVQLIQGSQEGYVELRGVPDMVLEVVSPSSVDKDTVELRDTYWRAGIREYWLVDPRGDRISFDILRHTAKGYSATRKQDGWVKSKVFGKSFRLEQHTDEQGYPDYTLHVR